MNILKKLSLITVTLLVMSFAAFSQDNGGKKDQPKKDGDKPKIVVKDKDKDKDKDKPPPRNDLDKPKKPQGELSGLLEVIKVL